MNKRIVFSVDIITDRSLGSICIAGRCCEDAISIGDVFTSVYNYTWEQLQQQILPEPINVRPIHLTVARIVMYRQSVDELSPGYTAELTLIGDSNAVVAVGDFIGGVK